MSYETRVSFFCLITLRRSQRPVKLFDCLAIDSFLSCKIEKYDTDDTRADENIYFRASSHRINVKNMKASLLDSSVKEGCLHILYVNSMR